MTTTILLLRSSYWIAAIADFAIAVLVWIPARMGVSEFTYPAGLASVIAFSWGVLLLVADRRPVERRWVLVPTVLVVSLITVVRTWFSVTGTIEFHVALFGFAIALLALMTYSYVRAGRQDPIEQSSAERT